MNELIIIFGVTALAGVIFLVLVKFGGCYDDDKNDDK